MYRRTAQAAAWTEAQVGQLQPVVAGRVVRAAAERTIWARVPLQTRRGRCVAVRLRGDLLLVGVAGSPAVQWLPARQVLTDAEAAAWLAAGFWTTSPSAGTATASRKRSLSGRIVNR